MNPKMELTIENVSRILKEELALKRISNEQFAFVMGVSHATIKRWLSVQGLTLEDLLKMMHALNLTFPDVLSRLDSNSLDHFVYTEKQEEAFVRAPGLLAFFQNLLEGQSAKEIMEEHQLPMESMMFYITSLQELELIRWGDEMECKVLKQGEARWRNNGPLEKNFRKKNLKDLMLKHQESESLKIEFFQLNEDAADQLDHMQAEMFRFAITADRHAKLKKEQTKGLVLTSLLAPHEPERLTNLER